MPVLYRTPGFSLQYLWRVFIWWYATWGVRRSGLEVLSRELWRWSSCLCWVLGLFCVLRILWVWGYQWLVKPFFKQSDSLCSPIHFLNYRHFATRRAREFHTGNHVRVHFILRCHALFSSLFLTWIYNAARDEKGRGLFLFLAQGTPIAWVYILVAMVSWIRKAISFPPCSQKLSFSDIHHFCSIKPGALQLQSVP